MATVRHLGLFPWCVDPASTFFETEAAIIEKAVPMWWRVKKWQFSCVVYLVDRDGNSSSFVFDRQLDVTEQVSEFYELPTNQQIKNEKSLVCYQNYNFEWEIVSDYENPSDAVATIAVGINPSISMRFNDGLPIYSKPYGYTPSPLEAPYGIIAVNFADKTFYFVMIGTALAPVPCGGGEGRLEFGDSCNPDNGELEFNPDAVRVTVVSGILTAAEYWPYDPGDGLGPIYDATTGAQLRAFPAD